MSDPEAVDQDSGFQPGGTPGGRWGCAMAGAVLACSLPLIGVAAMGTRGLGDWLLHGWLPAIVIAAGVGFAARMLVNRVWRGRGTADARGPLWPVAASAVLAAAAVVFHYWWWLRGV